VNVTAERILIVDDDETIRQIICICLSDEGYAVTEAANGLAAFAEIEVCPPSLILLDLRMPVMDGWEFARRYQAMPGPHAPILALVAAVNAEQECAGLQSNGILSKPFDLDDLIAAVRTQLALAN
jgi:CheY-like chemotaxis protein